MEIKNPNLKDTDLAYETGVHIGDGSMGFWTNHYRFVIYGDNNTEREYFKKVLIPL